MKYIYCLLGSLIFGAGVILLTSFAMGDLSKRSKPSLPDKPAYPIRLVQDGDSASLFIDSRTGCHYIVSPLGGVTPRLERTGKPFCE